MPSKSYASPDSIVANERLKRGQSTRGTKRYTTISSKSGPRRITAYQGTPVPPSKSPRQASKRATSVRAALARVGKSLSTPARVPGLEPEQDDVLGTILRVGDRVGATKKEKLAAVETGLVESNLRNLDYGDRDSLGWRQERAGQYGPENATDVKGGARRFFEESKTDTSEAQHRGKGMTAGQLAQAIQGSAFPERYDQMRPQAKALLRGASTPKVKPAKKDLKTLKRAGVSPKAAKKSPTPKKKAGQWAGSEKAVLSVIPKGIRAEGRDDKRTPEENAAVGGATASDHLTTNKKSYAADIPPDDTAAQKIANNLGMASHTGTNQVVKDGYEYTLIWQDAGHFDHIHLGAEWVGKGVPPGNRLGGSSSGGGGSSGGGAPSGGTASSSGKPAAKKSKATARERLQRVQTGLAGTGTTTSSDTAALRRRYGSPVV